MPDLVIGDEVPEECTPVANLYIRPLNKDEDGKLASGGGSGATSHGKLMLASRKQQYIDAFAANGLEICSDNPEFATGGRLLRLSVLATEEPEPDPDDHPWDGHDRVYVVLRASYAEGPFGNSEIETFAPWEAGTGFSATIQPPPLSPPGSEDPSWEASISLSSNGTNITATITLLSTTYTELLTQSSYSFTRPAPPYDTLPTASAYFHAIFNGILFEEFPVFWVKLLSVSIGFAPG